MRDPVTNSLIVEPDKLKATSLEYCINLLNNESLDPKYAREIFTENLLHYYRCYYNEEDDESLDYSDFMKRIQIVASKYGEKYQFVVNAGVPTE